MVIVIDTSIWVDHFRAPDSRLVRLIAHDGIVQHPFVTGEIVVGNLHRRDRAIWGLRNLPRLEPVDEAAFHDFLEAAELFGTGLGFVDIHLLAATATRDKAGIWTRDRRMKEHAERLGLLSEPVG